MDQIETGGIGERPEITVARQKRNAAIDAGLRDQRIAEASLAALCQDLRAQLARALPIAGLDVNERQLGESSRDLGRKFRVAQHFGEDHRHHQHLPVLKSFVEEFRILAARTFEKCDPRAGIDGDQRSAFSSAAVREK